MLCLCGIYEETAPLERDEKQNARRLPGEVSGQRRHTFRKSIFALTRLLGLRVSHNGEWVNDKGLGGKLRCEKVVRILSATDFLAGCNSNRLG